VQDECAGGQGKPVGVALPAFPHPTLKGLRRMLDQGDSAKADKIRPGVAVLGKQLTVEVRDAA